MKHLLFCAATLLVATGPAAADERAARYHVYTGTYMHVFGGRAEGIYRHAFDAATGQLGEAALATADVNEPSFLALHPGGKLLYAIGETSRGRSGIFAIEADGVLTRLPCDALRHGGCHLAVDPAGKYLALTGGGGFTVYELSDEGRVAREMGSVTHRWPASGRNAPFVHGVYFAPGDRLLAVDMGCEKVAAYGLTKELPLVEPFFSADAPKSGPRHLTLHPSGKFAYVLNELSGFVNVVSYDAQTGGLRNLQRLQAFEGESAKPWAAEIQVHPHRPFVYASLRGLGTIAQLEIKDEGAKLERVSSSPKIGVVRHFTVDPSGRWLLAGAGGKIHVLEIDPQSGALTKRAAVDSPSVQCIVLSRMP